MTDRSRIIRVLLDREVRVDDVEPTLAAIMQIKGVVRAEPGEPSDNWAVESAGKDACHEMLSAMYEVVRRLGPKRGAEAMQRLAEAAKVRS